MKQSRPQEVFQCHDGSFTNSRKKYVHSFHKATECFCKITKLTLLSFENEFQFGEVVKKSNGKKVLTKSYTISESFMERVIGGMELLKEQLQQLQEENKMLRGELELAESKRTRKTRKK